MHQVVITGIGLVSCLGIGVDAVGESLRKGRSGIVVDAERAALGFQSALTGRISGFDPQEYLSRKQRKTMPDFAIQAHTAAMEAIGMSGLAPEDLQNDQSGLIFGSDSSCLAATNQVERLRECGETRLIGSGLLFQSMTSTITMNLNTILGTRGACWTLSGACASGGHAVGQAADLIALGRQERMLCGGAQEINWQSMCSFDGLGAFSKRMHAPHQASRPFDASRDGLVPSGGAAALLLEQRDLAEKRGARILGTIAGYGFSSDGGSISVPSDTGLAAAMHNALRSAGLSPGEIDYLCAHATSTPAGDGAEARNIHAVFGELRPRISALKGLTGHEFWMAGAAQVAYTTIMRQQGFTAASANFETPDEHSAGLNILTEADTTPPTLALCNAAGFGGTNSSLVLRFS
ncbi:beta-ketoacyl-[acyl-carrier-protein] synthase family protein [Paucidesulfovibrio longus]|uniref:beta-ketoacyl-[acyl-carrier-protein] synthase family protein n=1 Tax=Paucidesulfovibrio longus TaxID=889 RepID=UPI0003B6B0C4|nr:beta-ketoacyl-[acyl-carrier-protein] synthase family protein [Paucidesulfovibrio longus]